MPSLWERLAVLWRDAGLLIRPGVQPPAIQAFEARYGVTLPSDMREYFLTIDGMEDELDPGLNRFWPLHMVKPVEDELWGWVMDELIAVKHRPDLLRGFIRQTQLPGISPAA